jgi:hypothetical protein
MRRLIISTAAMLFALASQAAVISTVPAWDGVDWNGSFGERNSATIGQTFTLSTQATVESFTFYLNDRRNPDEIDFEAYIFAWDDSLKVVTGLSLFQSAAMVTTNNGGNGGMEEFQINTGSVHLTAGKYVAFFTTSNLFDGELGTAYYGVTDGAAYNGGDLVYLNHSDHFDRLWTHTWGESAGQDLAFTIQTTPIPVPAAVWLFGSGLGLLGWYRRRQTA